ncbi:MAG: DNA alkylation repair protein [Bacteroidales bacterium]
MTVAEIMTQLEALGSEQTKKTWMRHGAKEPYFGVKIGDMKPIQKKVKENYAISMELYDTGNSDAMYLAGLIAEPKKMSKEDLQHWVAQATWYMISEFTVAWVASESAFGWEMGLQWIENEEEKIATAGWATLSSCLSLTHFSPPKDEELLSLLNKVKQNIYLAKNRVRHTMNHFIIATGSYLPSMTAKAKEIAVEIGAVEVDMGGTACKVPDAKEYIEKMEAKGSIGKKRKTARC